MSHVEPKWNALHISVAVRVSVRVRVRITFELSERRVIRSKSEKILRVEHCESAIALYQCVGGREQRWAEVGRG